MKFLVLGAVVRAVVESFLRGELDSIDEFDIRALVDLLRVASGKVRNEEADRAAGC